MPPPGRDPNVTYFDSDRRPLPGTEFQNNSGRYPIGGPFDPGGQQFPGWVDPNSGYVIEYDRDGNPYYAWYPNGQYQGGNPFIDGDAMMERLMYPRYTADRLPDPNWRPSRPGETPPWINYTPPSKDPTPEEKAKMDAYSASVDARRARYDGDKEAAFAAGAKLIKFDKNVPGWGTKNQQLWYYPPGYKGPRIKALGSNVEEKSTSDLSVLGGPSDAWGFIDAKGKPVSGDQASAFGPQPGAPAQQQNFGAPAPSQGANSMMGFGGGFGGGGMMKMGYGAPPQPNTGPANNPGMGGGQFASFGANFGGQPQQSISGMNDMAAKMKQMSAGNQGGAAPNFANMFSGMQNMFNNAGGPQVSGGNMGNMVSAFNAPPGSGAPVNTGNMGASLGNAMSAYGQGNPFSQVQNAMAPAYGMRPSAGGGSVQNPGQMQGMEDNIRRYREAMAAADKQLNDPDGDGVGTMMGAFVDPTQFGLPGNYGQNPFNSMNYFSSMMNPYARMAYGMGGGMGGMGFGFNPFRMGRPNFY